MIQPAEKPQHLMVCVIFFYAEARLQYLVQATEQMASLAETVTVYLVTNTSDETELQNISGAIGGKGLDLRVEVPRLLGHPFLLPWCYQPIFRRAWQETAATHFLYIEDDMLVTESNIRYWMSERERLRPFGVIPSFLRYEVRDEDGGRFCSDIPHPGYLGSLPKIVLSREKVFVNLAHPYQAVFLLDRELLQEHLEGRSSNPEFGPWDIRADASQGVTYQNVPANFTARNLIEFNPVTGAVAAGCLIHHLPNTYVNRKYDYHGRIPVSKVVSTSFLTWLKNWVQHGLYRKLRRDGLQLRP